MIVIRCELHSAITGQVSEIGRVLIDNQGGTQTRGNYRVRSLRGRSSDQFNREVVQKEAQVLNHPRLAEHVWNLVAKSLKACGYGEAKSKT